MIARACRIAPRWRRRSSRRGFTRRYAEYYAKVSQRALSSLAAISDDAFARGLAAFERHCREAEDRPIYEPIELFLFRA